jgi:hypothetical protein
MNPFCKNYIDISIVYCYIVEIDGPEQLLYKNNNIKITLKIPFNL